MCPYCDWLDDDWQASAPHSEACRRAIEHALLDEDDEWRGDDGGEA